MGIMFGRVSDSLETLKDLKFIPVPNFTYFCSYQNPKIDFNSILKKYVTFNGENWPYSKFPKQFR